MEKVKSKNKIIKTQSNRVQGSPLVAGFEKNSFVDYPAKIASVIFLGGCNFVCHYCHNNNILCTTSNIIEFDEVLEQIKERVGFIDGVVISGGEPTLHKDLYTIIREIKKLGLLVKLDTNGTNSAMLADLIEKKLVDFVAMDVKAPLERYGNIVFNACNEIDNNKKLNLNSGSISGDINDDRKNITGNRRLISEVEKSIKYLKSQKIVDYMFRTTLSPLLTEDDIRALGRLIDGAKCFQLQQFVPNAFSNSHHTVLLPYSKFDAEKFGLLLSKHCEKFVMRGF